MRSSITLLSALTFVLALVLASAAQTAAFDRASNTRPTPTSGTIFVGQGGLTIPPSGGSVSRPTSHSTPSRNSSRESRFGTSSSRFQSSSTYSSSPSPTAATPPFSSSPAGQTRTSPLISPTSTFVSTLPAITQPSLPSPQATSALTTTSTTRTTPPAPTLVTRIRTYHNLPVTVCLASSAISLVFEQGPDPVLTPQYLDVLRELGIQATFFVLGQHVTPATIPIVQRAESEGHLIGFSSWSVQSFPTLTMEQVNHEVSATARIVTNARKGLAPLYFRFPNGEFTPSQLSWVTSQGYLTVGSSLDVDDVSGLDPRQLFVKWQQRLSPLAASNRYIAVAHDAENSTLPVLRNIVALARARGYSFLRLDDCLERDENTLKQIRRHEGLGNGMLIPRLQGNGTGGGRAAGGQASKANRLLCEREWWWMAYLFAFAFFGWL
ncbi:hypothetical protein BCR44DRAFT_1269655 [Catenaria anguillulae PL171]|uniref:NodB homology domain-containing protein n=1 Tax=Catenaria anguillulae PL171 TaxID=765915 RepID=A0A1Y2HXH8_9FUNG|nr:hypothetical protein BCR44DRAFT_1269655 [Catenaria anguillulae PL171]